MSSKRDGHWSAWSAWRKRAPALRTGIIRSDGGGVTNGTTEADARTGRRLTASLRFELHRLGPKLDRFVKNREFSSAYSQVDVLRSSTTKQCGDCRLRNAGANNRYADCSSGCCSCHMTYALDGKSRSGDTFIRRMSRHIRRRTHRSRELRRQRSAEPERRADRSAHPAYHRLTRQMSSRSAAVMSRRIRSDDWRFRGYQIDRIALR